MKIMRALFIGIVIAVILAGIFACASQKDTAAYLESVDAFIQEVER